MSLRLNGIDPNVFKSNGGNVFAGISRDDLVSVGRLVAVEYAGRQTNKLRKCEDFTSYVKEETTYENLSQTHKQKKMIYCAAMAYQAQGKPAPESYGQVSNDLSLMSDPIFLRTMAGIDREIITPILARTISNAGGMLMETVTVPMGQTKEIDVGSNEIFLFEDSSWGANRSAPTNYLYSNTVTLNPHPYTANATIKWFQMIANNDDSGKYYNAIMAGMYSKIMALYTNAITSVATNANYVPSYLQFTSYTSANWASAIVGVQTANNLPRDQIAAYGEYRALQKVLPSGTANDAALTYGLGLEWVQKGFLGTVGGVPLFEVENALVPGTVNTTGTFVYPTTTIILAGRPGAAYAPVYTAFADGSPITIEMNPSKTANFSLDISVTAVMDTKVVMGSKISVMTGVT